MNEPTGLQSLTCSRSKRFRRFSTVWFVSLLIFFELIFWNDFRKPHSAPRTNNLLFLGFATAISGSFFILAVRQSFIREPYITVSPEGLRIPTTGMPLIPWRDIRELRLRRDIWHSYIDLFLHSRDAYICRLAGWRRVLAKLRRKTGDGDLSFIISSLDTPPDEIYQAMQRFLSKPPPS